MRGGVDIDNRVHGVARLRDLEGRCQLTDETDKEVARYLHPPPPREHIQIFVF